MNVIDDRAKLNGLVEALSDDGVATVLQVVRNHLEHHEFVETTLDHSGVTDDHFHWELEDVPAAD